MLFFGYSFDICFGCSFLFHFKNFMFPVLIESSIAKPVTSIRFSLLVLYKQQGSKGEVIIDNLMVNV